MHSPQTPGTPDATDLPGPAPGTELRRRALQALQTAEPAHKLAQVQALRSQWAAGLLTLDITALLQAHTPLPGRPPLPRLVPQHQVPRRSPFTPAGRAALLHAVAHIEFNAINLALDACWRFAGLPQAFYADWLQVASEEALHFSLLAEHLASLGHAYGDFDAHDGLWAMTERTAGDVTARMALVPRTLEARGLDATPPMQARLQRAGDGRAVDILAIILRDEVGHVAIGNRWYRWLCEREGLDPVSHYAVLATRFGAPVLRGPFNVEARQRAGFTPAELQALQAADAARSGP